MTGVLPPKATDISDMTETLPPLHTQTDIPKSVSMAVQKGMAVNEMRRFQSIADFAYALYPGQSVLGTLPRQFSTQKIEQHDANGRKQTQPFHVKQSVTMPVQRNIETPRSTNAKPREIIGKRNEPILVCTQGIMKGFRMNLPAGKIQSIGREPGKAIQYPDYSSGVSRKQCSILRHTNGEVYVRDDGSTYGTGVNGIKLSPGSWKPLKSGDVIAFGREAFVLY